MHRPRSRLSDQIVVTCEVQLLHRIGAGAPCFGSESLGITFHSMVNWSSSYRFFTLHLREFSLISISPILLYFECLKPTYCQVSGPVCFS